MEKNFSPASGIVPFDTKNGGIGRDIIRLESATPNCYIVAVQDENINPPKSLNDTTRRSGLDISGLPSGFHISVVSMSYSGDTKITTKIRLDK